MKIPTLEGPRVAPSGQRAPQIEVARITGFDEARQGFAALGRGVNTAMGEIERNDAAIEKEAEKARAAASVSAETQLTKGITEEFYGTPGASGDIEAALTGQQQGAVGYLSKQGREAQADNAGVMERIEKRRGEIAKGLRDPAARDLFLKRTGGMLEDARRRAGSHQAEQRRIADQADLKAGADASLEAIYAAARGGDGATVERHAARMEGPLSALSASPADAERDKREWQRQVAATQMKAFLDVERFDVARAMLNDDKVALTPDDRKRFSTEVERKEGVVEAQQLAATVLRSGLAEDGAVDQTAVLDALGKVPAEKQEKVAPIAYRMMAEREQAYAAETKRLETTSFALYNEVGWGTFLKSDVAERLNKRSPELYHRLKNDSRAQVDRHRREQRASAADLREQKAIDRIARNEFLSLPDAVQKATSIEEFLAGRGVSDEGKSVLGPLQKAAGERIEKGASQSKDEFVSGVLGRAFAYTSQGSAKEQKERKAQVIAEATEEYQVLFYEGKGRVDPEAARKATARLLVPKLPGDARVLKDHVNQGKPTAAERVEQLKKQGVSKADGLRILKAEGY